MRRGARGSRSSAKCSRGSSTTGSTATRRRATGWTSEPRSATCRRPGTSSSARSAPRWARRSVRPGRALPRDAARRDVHAPAVIGPGCTIAADSSVTGRSVLGAGVTIGSGATIDGSVLLDGGDDRRAHPGHPLDRRSGRLDRRSLPHRGDRDGRPGVRLGIGNTLTAGVRIFPESTSRRGDRVLTAHRSRWQPTPRRLRRRPGRQFADMVGLSDHLRDALWRVESADDQAAGLAGRPRHRRHGRLGDRRDAGAWRCSATAPRGRWSVARDYALPSWTTPDTTVLCASYSGDTEETLAAFEAAGALGARRLVSTDRRRARRQRHAPRGSR